MPFNGNGVFVRLYSWTQDAAAGIKIRADRTDNETNGIATGLSNCVTKDGQTTVTANLPMAGFRFTNVADAVNKNEYYTLNQAMNGIGPYPAIVGGTADAITVGYSPTYTTLANPGIRGSFIASANNTGAAATLAIDTIAAKPFTKYGSTPLALGDITTGMLVEWEWDGTQIQLLNPNITTSSITGKVSRSGDSMTGALNFSKSTDIASAATTDLATSTGNYVTITGTTTITALGTLQAGSTRFLRFAGSLTLTYNATSLILPTLASITTQAGDTCIAISEGAGNWRIVDYQRADGTPLVQTVTGKIPVAVYNLTAGQASQPIINLVAGSDYEIELIGVYGSALSEIILRTSTDNGVTFNSTASAYNNYLWGNVTGPSGSADTKMYVSYGNVNTTADGSYSGTLKIYQPNNAAVKTRNVSVGGVSNDAQQQFMTAQGRRATTEANNAVQILMLSGTLQAGIIKVFRN